MLSIVWLMIRVDDLSIIIVFSLVLQCQDIVAGRVAVNVKRSMSLKQLLIQLKNLQEVDYHIRDIVCEFYHYWLRKKSIYD